MNPEMLALLAQLRDIQQPDTGGFAVAPVWFVVVFLLLLTLLVARRLLLRHSQRRAAERWRSDARVELKQIYDGYTPQSANVTVAQCSGLLRRIALAVKPRSDVASLTGQEWIDLLDQVHGSNAFSKSQRQLLLEFAYRKPQADVQHRANTVAHEQPATEASELNLQNASHERIHSLLGLTSELIERAAPSINKMSDGTVK